MASDIVSAGVAYITVAYLAVFVAPIATAEIVSPWVQSHYSKARLLVDKPNLDMAMADGEQIIAGIHIKLDEGWKTYWYNPGDSGLPPQFSWSRTQNLKSVRILWPAPHRFTDPFGTSIGYENEVLFPVLIDFKKSEKKRIIKLDLDYAICKDICVPVSATFDLDLVGLANATGANSAIIQRFIGRVPVNQPSGQKNVPTFIGAKAQLKGPKPSIVIEAHFPRGSGGADLFADSTTDVYLPPPQKIENLGDGNVRFTINIDPKTRATKLMGDEIVLTMVSDGGSGQTRWIVK